MVRKGGRKRSRWSVRMEERSSLMQGLEQGRTTTTQVAERSKLELQQENGEENGEGGENSEVLAGVGSPPSIAVRGELQGGSCDSGASPFHVNYSEIPPSPPPQAPVQGPDRAAFGISKTAEVAVPAIDSVKSKQTQSPGDGVDDRDLLTRPKRKSSAEGIINDNHDPDGFSKNLDPVGPAPTGTHHSSHEEEHGSLPQSQMPGAKDTSGRSVSTPWIGLPCSLCKSKNFVVYTDANAESIVNWMHHQCNSCKLRLCRENERSYKHLGPTSTVENREKQGVSQHTRRAIIQRGIKLSSSNQEPSTLAVSNSNRKAMPPPSSTQKPNVCLPASQDTALHSAKTTPPSRSSSCSDKLEDDHPSRESNLQLVVAPEQEERFPRKVLEAKEPFHLSADLKEPPSIQSAKGNQKEPSFANDGFSVKGLRDSIRGHRSLPVQDNKKGSGGGTGSDGGRPSNGLPCPNCKCINTRFCSPGHHCCHNCGEYWTFVHLQQHEVQLPSKQSAKGKEKEKEKETPYEDADQFPGKGVGDSSRGSRSLPLHGSEDDRDGGSNERPFNALSCSQCKSTFTRLCTYGVFCDDCGKYSPFEVTSDHEVTPNPPVAMVHEVFDADGRSRGHQQQSPPPPRRPIIVDASTQTDPVAVVPVDSRFGKHIVHGLLHTDTHQQVDERNRRSN